PTACGIGACAATGQLRCVDGAPSDDCEPAAPTPDEDCDGVDDDCDGTPDDGYVPQVTTCGVGACQATGTTSCLAGQVADSCTPLPGQGSDAICNGIDDDCDGSPDEDYAPQPTSCGVGACAATGTSACVDGEEQSGCTPLAPGPADTGCDGVDDDCNGTADDGFVPEPIACGLGLCAATGIRTCEAGALVDHCTAPEPSVLEDLVCDGLDEDCDGSVDEDFAASATSCGSGVCHASGHTTCVAAQVIDTCAPGSPTGPDDDCNGVDEDCDGTADDGFVATPTSCGIGACARTGTRSCSGGTIADSCQPGAPPGDDEDCNGVDEDCDGAADDGFLPTPTTCGIGACAATGATWCDDGMVLDSCQPGTGAPSDATCDGLDDDCDGGTDEDFVPSCAGASRVICAGGALVSTDCGDGDACNGTETCSGAGVCILGIPPIIDDDNPCTDDACDPAMGVVHTATPAETPCGTGLWCDGAGNCIEAAQPPVIVTQPASLAVSVGQSWAFEVVATGNDLTYRWQRFGADVPGADTAAYGGDEASYDESGAEYRVVIENARGSVVSAPAVLSVIDDVAPVLTVSGAAERTTVEDRMALTGTVTDLGSGVVSVVVTSDRQPGQVFGGVLGPSATFSVEVSLSTGPNALIVVATDGEANQAAVPILVEATLPALPRVAILTPPNGSLVTVPLVDVTGRVHSSLPPEAIRLRLGSTVTFPEGTDGEYTFSFPSVHLVAGRNLLQVVAESAPGNATATSTVTYQEFVTPEEPLPPVITLLGVQEQQWVQGDSLPVSGWVEAETPVTRVTVNGQDARITGTGTRVSFDALLALPAGEDEVPVLVQAEDASGEGAELGFVVRHDSVSPAIAVDVLQPPPAVTSVTVSPYTITGHVTEPNLAGFTVNGRSIALSPGSDDVWSFDFDLALVRGVETTLAFEAWDHAGNRTTHGALVRLDAALSIEILQPSTGDQLVAQGDPLEVSVRARIPGVAPTDRITAAVGERPAVPLAVAATLASGTVTLPGADAAHELVVAVSTSDGTPLAQAVVRFRIVSDASIPVRVVRQSPENGAEHIEPEQALSFVFNKPIDFDRLQVVVSETVRGKTLAEPAPGADLTVFSDLRLADVNRQAEPVAGGLSFFVGDQMVAFYARGGFTWGATEQITVLYDGAEVHRGRVTVRPLPTLVQGFLVDQFDNALANVPVELVGLGRRTVSDAEGYFTFGFGTHADSIPAGRHLVRANPDLAEPTHGSLDFWVNAEAQHLTSIGVLSLPMLDRSISRRYVASGAAVELPDVGLTLDLTGAEVLFPDARASGELHVQKLALGRFSYPMVPMAMPAWVYAFQPSRIEVAGEIAFTAALEGQLGESELLDLPLDRVLIVAVDPDALMLVPAGVARVDREAAALVSERLEVERLDFLGVMVAPSVWQESLQRYATGELTLVELVARLSES
ncbi:MAG: hypothetical protein JW751_01650, partial [Polyangiaceae bacterium]|nr:hypothetical protein [Polyangiaceae bacterium]